MKNVLLLLPFAVLLANPANSQSVASSPPAGPYYATRTVRGVVTEFVTHAPLGKVTVYLKNTTDSVLTDEKGHYTLRVPRSAPVGLYFYRSGYVTVARSVGQGQVKNVRLWHGTSLLMDSLLQQHRAAQPARQLAFAAADTVRRIAVSGRVTDRATGAALANVVVKLENTGQRDTTDANGRYQFAQAPEDETMRVRPEGYQPKIVPVQRRRQVDIALEKFVAPTPRKFVPVSQNPSASTGARSAQARLDAEKTRAREAARIRQRDF